MEWTLKKYQTPNRHGPGAEAFLKKCAERLDCEYLFKSELPLIRIVPSEQMLLWVEKSHESIADKLVECYQRLFVLN